MTCDCDENSKYISGYAPKHQEQKKNSVPVPVPVPVPIPVPVPVHAAPESASAYAIPSEPLQYGLPPSAPLQSGLDIVSEPVFLLKNHFKKQELN